MLLIFAGDERHRGHGQEAEGPVQGVRDGEGGAASRETQDDVGPRTRRSATTT